jgi:acetyl-CoA C-acetyltransferase
MTREAVIVSAVRTPIAKYGSALKEYEGYELGGIAVKEAVARAGIDPKEITEVYIGNAEGAPGDLGRVVALEAGLPVEIPGIQFDRQCASGLETINVAAAMVESGHGDVYVAGGAESMTNNPYFMKKINKPYRYYPLPEFFTVVMSPPKGEYGNPDMGVTAENVLDFAKEHFGYEITREELDAFAAESHRRAAAAIESGAFKEQIVPVPSRDRKKKGEMFDTDESPRPETTVESLGKLRPVFKKDGSVTAGNSCPTNDAASAVVVMSAEKAAELGKTPLLKVKGFASVGLDPNYMGLGPIGAVRKLLDKTGVSIDEVEVIEINEAFASQALISCRELGLDMARVNPDGGAIALGHALGATGAILTTKAAYWLKNHPEGRKYAIVTMCVGGGEGSAAMFERP